MDIRYILSLLIFFIITLLIFKKYKVLQEDISYSGHKKLGKNNKNPILIGGFFLIISLLIFLPKDLSFFKIAAISIFLLGILSDKNIITSPKLRLFFQIIIILFLVHFENLRINGINISFIDGILIIEPFNYFFTILCFAVLINGSNFIDGLNGLLSGYFILVLISILYITHYQINLSNDVKEIVNLILILTIIFYIFNLFGIVYLGDSGSYLLSFSIGFILIKLQQESSLLSPYYIANMLWYPAFENLFSLLRRYSKKSKISLADKLHLHQLIFRFLKSKNIVKKNRVNTLSGLIIVSFNLPMIYFATKFYYHSIYLISIIVCNLIFYLLIYYVLSKNFKFKK